MTRPNTTRCIAILLLKVGLSACLFGAETETLEPGHSHQDDSFNEGPRQSYGLIGGTGEVTIPIKTTWGEGQGYFDQGLFQEPHQKANSKQPGSWSRNWKCSTSVANASWPANTCCWFNGADGGIHSSR